MPVFSKVSDLVRARDIPRKLGARLAGISQGANCRLARVPAVTATAKWHRGSWPIRARGQLHGGHAGGGGLGTSGKCNPKSSGAHLRSPVCPLMAVFLSFLPDSVVCCSTRSFHCLQIPSTLHEMSSQLPWQVLPMCSLGRFLWETP